MSPEHPELSSSDKGVLLAVHIQPGAGISSLVGRHGDALKIRVAAPPTAGRANDAVVALVAREFGLAVADVEITSGASSREKKVRLGDLSLEDAASRIDTLIGGGRTR